jgi:hypothetical protein
MQLQCRDEPEEDRSRRAKIAHTGWGIPAQSGPHSERWYGPTSHSTTKQLLLLNRNPFVIKGLWKSPFDSRDDAPFGAAAARGLLSLLFVKVALSPSPKKSNGRRTLASRRSIMLQMVLSHWVMAFYLPAVTVLFVLVVLYRDKSDAVSQKSRHLPGRMRTRIAGWRSRPHLRPLR